MNNSHDVATMSVEMNRRKESIYFDEEDVLGYKIWVAELELLVSQQKHSSSSHSSSTVPGRVDFLACYTLLQKLNATIDETEVHEIKEYQRRCEDALVDILLKGCPPPIRRLICSSLGKLYGKGDQLPLFSRVSSLQLFLGTKEAFGSQTSENIRLGALELMSTLYYAHGKSLTVGVLETCLIASKYCSRSCSIATRQAGLKLLAATVEGVGFQHREATQVQCTALKCIEKIMKEKDVGGFSVKLGVSDVLRAIVVVVPVESWGTGVLSLDSVRNLCMNGLKDSSLVVRHAYGRALGDLVASLYKNMQGDESMVDKSMIFEKIDSFFGLPLMESLAAEDRTTSIAISKAWVHFLSSVKDMQGFDDTHFLELAKGPLMSVRAAGTISKVERGTSSPDIGLGVSISTGERPFSQACVIYIVRCGIIEYMSEYGQKELLRSLSKAVTSSFQENAPSLIITQLELIKTLMETLGEVGHENADLVEHVLESCFVCPSAAVRWHAGSVVAALSITEPGRAANLFKKSLLSLKNAADALVDSSSAVSDKTRCSQGVPRWHGTSKFSREIDHLHGWTVACACLNSSFLQLPLGIPSSYPKIASQIAAALIESPRSEHPGGIKAELEAGYILLGSLCKHAKESIKYVYKDSILKLWSPLFSETSNDDFQSILEGKDEQEISSELWWRSEALRALSAYINSDVLNSNERDALCDFLSSTISILAGNKMLSNPINISSRGTYSQLQAAAAVFQIRLFRMLLSVNTWSSETCQRLCSVCIDGMITTGMHVSSLLELQGFLTNILDLEAPMMRERFFSSNAFESDLLQFSGASGGIEKDVWNLRVSSQAQRYSQSQSLSEALLLIKTQLISRILQVDNDNVANVVQKLADMPGSIRKDKTGTKKLCLMLIEAAPYILLAKYCEKNICLPQGSIEVVNNLASEISMFSSHGIWVQATASNLYFALSRMSSQNSHHLLSEVCSKTIKTASLDQRITYVLSIGNISRGIGGISMTTILPKVVETLLAVARASPSSIFSCIAHSITMTALSSGPSFLEFVEATLQMTRELLLDENIYSTPGLLTSIGQLGNAMVACLGPDYVLGSQSYDICRSIVSEMGASDRSCIRLKEDILSGSLQAVLYIQMLVLFAPRTSKIADHVSFLIQTLPSGQPYLRRAAADTLRHLAEKETLKVLEQKVEGDLLAAYDKETDEVTSRQLHGTIDVLLKKGAPKQPSRWISLLGAVATSFGATNTVLREENFDGNMEETKLDHLEVSRILFHPRLRTRLLAAEGLNLIPRLAFESCPCYCDEASNPRNRLVTYASILVDTGFKMVSGDIDVLRSKGVTLLLETLNVLGDLKDPFMPEELLMCQFQAQYVSALRMSLSKDASPVVHVAGCSLVASFLQKNIIRSENILMEKILALLCEPLSLWSSGASDPTQIAYAEWVAAGARAALLESHAICATLHIDSDSPKVLQYCDLVKRAHGPFYTILVDCWTGLLEDAFASAQDINGNCGAYILRLYGRPGSSKAPTLSQAKRGMWKVVQTGWPSILDAATYVLLIDRTVSHGDSGKLRFLTLFRITIGFYSMSNHLKAFQTILRVLERLTQPRFVKDGWLNYAMMKQIVTITQHIMRMQCSTSTDCHVLRETGSRVVQNLMKCSPLNQEEVSASKRLPWALDCIRIVHSLSPMCLENSLCTLRLALASLISQSAPVEEICLLTYHSIKCGFELSKSSDVKVASLSYGHIVETAKVAATQSPKVCTASAMDPGIPSIQEILTKASSDACRQIESTDEIFLEYLIHAVLALGGLTMHYLEAQPSPQDVPSGTAHEDNCRRTLIKLVHSKYRNKLFTAFERWLEEQPSDLCVGYYGGILYPTIGRILFEYSIRSPETQYPEGSEAIQTIIHISRHFGMNGSRFGDVCICSIIPPLVRIAGSSQDKLITASCVASLLGLAKGTSSMANFKTVVSRLPEGDRLNLHHVLASGAAQKNPDMTENGSSGLVVSKALQSLDLSRFT